VKSQPGIWFVLTAAGLSLGAQQPVFRSGVDSVAIWVTVNGPNGRLVPDLQRDDFRILDDGVPVPVTVFSNEIQTITAVLMMDMSPSMYGRVQWMREAAGHFVEALAGADRAAIGSFGFEIVVNPNLTAEKSVLHRVLREELWPGGGSWVWQGIDAGMTALAGEKGRRVVVALTEGDNVSWDGVDDGDLKRRGTEQGFVVYAVSVNRHGLSRAIKEVALETGGGFVEIGDDENLSAAMDRVVEELRHQYLVGFVPRVVDGKPHKLSIEMRAPGMKARGPRSYVAVPKGR
jgi:Ca-activated chloride channel family protein